jgi:hypothetical protein
MKNSSLEEILTVMLAQLEGGLRGYMSVLDMTNGTKRKKILNFVVAYNLMVANNTLKEEKSHLISFNNGQHSSQIDFILTTMEKRPNYNDCKVIPDECVVTQHKFLVTDFHFQVRVRRDKDMKITRTK